jgi:hypothetical protein
MKKFILLLCLGVLAFASPADARHKNAQQPPNPDAPYMCVKDQDCTVVHPPCSAPLTVNYHYRAQMEAQYDQVRHYYHCADWIELPEVKSLSCIEHRCKAVLGPPVPDTSPQAKDPHYCDKDSECEVLLGPCCSKDFVNSKSAPKLRKKAAEDPAQKTCFFPDRRHVQHLRCEKHQCTADLEVPLELPDDNHSLKDKCEQ